MPRISSLSTPWEPSKADPRLLSCCRVGVDVQRPLIRTPSSSKAPVRFLCSLACFLLSTRSLIRSFLVRSASFRRRWPGAAEGWGAGVVGIGKSFGQSVQKKPWFLLTAELRLCTLAKSSGGTYPEQTRWFGSTDRMCLASVECHFVMVWAVQSALDGKVELHLW